ncbi:MAG TPA: HDOD domain-containing protein [Candidatus Acidoferrum sp.]|nr:HDOD domain-containing protein [Candidatus Acidoferrum sp.]
MNPATYDILTQRIKKLGNLPAMPAILSRLCEMLSRKSNQIDVDKVVEQISYDKSLAAQCLRLANSALFRQRGDVTTVREAVFALGLWRIRDLAFSCSLPMMFANLKTTVGKEVFWRHALGTASVAQALGHELGAKGTEEIYLAGLLHDIGILVNGVLFAEEFGEVLEEAKQKKTPIEEVEQKILGFSHAESGRILAELWRLPVNLSESIEYHCRPQDQKSANEITLLVHTADLTCQKLGMGYGYELASDEATSLERIWEPLCPRFPMARAFSEAAYTQLLIHYVSEADILADHVFTPTMGVRHDVHCDSHSR